MVSTLSFIFYSLLILLPRYLCQIPFSSRPWGKILMPPPQSQLCVCSSRWETVAIAANPASDTPVQGHFLCWLLLGRRQICRRRRRRRRCSYPTEKGTSSNNAPVSLVLSSSHRASRDAFDVYSSTSSEDLHPNFGDPLPAGAGGRNI